MRDWVFPVGIVFVVFTFALEPWTILEKRKPILPPGPPYWLYNNMETEPTLVSNFPDNREACELLAKMRDELVDYSKSRCEPVDIN